MDGRIVLYQAEGRQMYCIVIEALSARRGGGLTYLRNLFQYYRPVKGERITVILPKEANEDFATNTDIDILAPEFGSKSVVHRVLWQLFVLPRVVRLLNASVVYCPGGLLSIRSSKSVLTAVACRNLLPFFEKERTRYRRGYMRARLWVLKHLQGKSFREADLVIFVSEYAKVVVDRAAKSRKGRSVVIPHGVGEEFRLKVPRIRDPRLPYEYVLYVSILDVYKAQVEVIRAWHLMRQNRETTEKLILIGPEYSPYGRRVRREIKKLNLLEEVSILGEVPHKQVPAYLQHAKINLFALSSENCPNILLEALTAGQPVLCSNDQPMPKFGLDSVQYFDPYNPKELATKLAATLDDPDAKANWGNRAARGAEVFRWQVTADNTWSALRQLTDKTP